MSNSIAVSGGDFTPLPAEKALRAFLGVVFLLPVAVIQYFWIMALCWLIYRLLRSIVSFYATLQFTSRNRDQIATVRSNLADLSEPLKQFHAALCDMDAHNLYFMTSKVKRAADLVDSYGDLVLAYEIFSEPVEREYPVSEEFANLQRGRKLLSERVVRGKYPTSNEREPFAQIVFPSL